jgi:hypothetical protein
MVQVGTLHASVDFEAIQDMAVLTTSVRGNRELKQVEPGSAEAVSAMKQVAEIEKDVDCRQL